MKLPIGAKGRGAYRPAKVKTLSNELTPLPVEKPRRLREQSVVAMVGLNSSGYVSMLPALRRRE